MNIFQRFDASNLEVSIFFKSAHCINLVSCKRLSDSWRLELAISCQLLPFCVYNIHQTVSEQTVGDPWVGCLCLRAFVPIVAALMIGVEAGCYILKQ